MKVIEGYKLDGDKSLIVGSDQRTQASFLIYRGMVYEDGKMWR